MLNKMPKSSIFSHPDFTVGSRFSLDQPYCLKTTIWVAGFDYCRLGFAPYPEDEYTNFIDIS
ncbi:hypothetical protein SAP2_13560 [Staphylococcus arlettae]|uniref:Uncharacterized protein n=1 Tax=Staphylococcus arlettae TaxID=29378 RepID=A0ABQ0XPX8_9STAP|nr:hypothetical protein SARL_12706 [Staphylococcus arlettae CVD059]ERF49831.1 hypothetical protein N039_00080 [Staphylococcus sp. EGD-HP3]BBK28172.1 hypothetical protein SAP2_13560 [Staphylococcus arlettae]GEP98978.1 hypothetical protein SAR03_00160 [Staphylococcus arlettae]